MGSEILATTSCQYLSTVLALSPLSTCYAIHYTEQYSDISDDKSKDPAVNSHWSFSTLNCRCCFTLLINNSVIIDIGLYFLYFLTDI